MNNLIKFWSDLDTTPGEGKQYIHPEDLAFLSKYEDKYFYKEDQDKYSSDKHKGHVHVNLLPSPYMGDLDNAKVYLHMLNPGFSVQEYIDHEDASIWESLRKSIKQEFTDNKYLEQYKFFYMHPDFKKAAGGAYIYKYLKACMGKYQDKTKKSIDDVLKVFSDNVCFIQAFPYHSAVFTGRLNTITKKLPSHDAAREFIMSISNDPQKLVFIVRGYRFFDHKVPQDGNMIPFTRPSEYRGNHFPVCQKYHDVKHGCRLVNHLIKYG